MRQVLTAEEEQQPLWLLARASSHVLRSAQGLGFQHDERKREWFTLQETPALGLIKHFSR